MKITKHTQMTKNTLKFIILLLLSCKVTAEKQKPANKTSDQIFVNILQNTCTIYEYMRTDNGLYLDALYKNSNRQSKNFTVSTASVGAGLISLAIANKAKIDPQAANKVITTFKTLLGKNSIKPERNKNGLYRHFFNAKSGLGKSEFSTIDKALLMTGVNFCRNEFKEHKIISEIANQLLFSVNWQSCKKNTRQYYMVQDLNGKPSAVTKIFNEYLILADLCSWSAQAPPVKITQDWLRAELNGKNALSDLSQRMLPLFTFVFPLYLSPYRANDKSFLVECLLAAEADKNWWSYQTSKSYLWGSSAGASKKGYNVDHPGKNTDLYVHAPAIMAFSPFEEEYKNDFMKLTQYENAIFFNYSEGRIPWRYSEKFKDWQAHRVEGVDLSPLLFGSAALSSAIGFEYFQRNSRLPVK